MARSAEEYEKLIEKCIRYGDVQSLRDGLMMCKGLEKVDALLIEEKGIEGQVQERVVDQGNFDKAHALARRIRGAANALVKRGGGQEALELYYNCHLFDAPYWFDSFCIYIEKDREPEKKFYMPRRKQLLPLAEALQDLEDGKLYLLGISMPPGTGKALANDTPILTRNGWKNHGDLVVGDEVIGMDGEFKKVIAVHPKCILDVMVEFTNGEKIQCHENHEWMVHDRSSGKTYTQETKYFEKRDLEYGGEPGNRGHRYVLQLPHREYVMGEKKDLALDPYLLGVWLGDGANRNPRICGDKKDIAIICRIIRKGYSPRWTTIHKDTGVWYYDFDIRKQLQSFGMCHSRKMLPKHIPQEYLTASVEQRLELLAGLIDTDGTLSGSKYIFSTSEESLRDSFCELVSTFGWRCCIKYYPPTISSTGVHSRKGYYAISFTPDTLIPCSLERKWNKDPRPQRAIAFKSITRVEPKEGNCITVEGDGMYLAGKSMIPTHNTTLAEFFLAWECGKHPELSNLIGSHSYPFVDGMYSEMLRLFDPLGEYRWKDVFPEVRVINQSARMRMIDLGHNKKEGKRFMTLEFGTLGSSLAGRVRAMNLLYCDDLVDGIEAALSRDRMDKLWQQYYTDLRQRKIGDRCKELHIATRWSVNDVLGRLELEYAGDEYARFITCSALDENDESNFDYPYGLGYTTEDLHKQREIMDDASWRALYLNEPVEREGLLFSPEELRYYYELPDKDPDTIVAICDTKEQGSDFCVCPILYRYGNDFYMDDIICDNGKVEILEERVSQILVDKKVRECRIESNRGGMLFAQNVEKRIHELGGMTHITTKWTQSNKEARIQTNSGTAKSHILFRAEGKRTREYQTAMTQLTTYTMMGKNKNDDVCDCLSLFIDWQIANRVNIAQILKRPF